jgi:hypothetical protein
MGSKQTNEERPSIENLFGEELVDGISTLLGCQDVFQGDLIHRTTIQFTDKSLEDTFEVSYRIVIKRS